MDTPFKYNKFTNLHCNESLLSLVPGLEDGGLLGSLGEPGAPAYSPYGGRGDPPGDIRRTSYQELVSGGFHLKVDL